jgi:formylglycine-generating enzyme required for sulfatase activity
MRIPTALPATAQRLWWLAAVLAVFGLMTGPANCADQQAGLEPPEEGTKRLEGSELLSAKLSARLTAQDGVEMLLVPAGPFLRGSLDGDADERPPHRVTLPAFYIDRFEVTHEQYATFVKATGRKPPIDWPEGRMPPKLAKHPVVNVTWADATAYAQWAGKRLPTEAEWEKAARGTDGRNYPWGNDPARKSGSGADAKDATHSEGRTFPVGSFPDDTSPYGVMDMAGNVWEWTADWYAAYPGNDSLELEFGRKFKVIRGGGAIDYYGAASTRRCADRARSVPYGTYDALGFRCVKEAK